ncbi:MAG: C39 family peptidase [Candidatus Hecatellaceae archaeon]
MEASQGQRRLLHLAIGLILLLALLFYLEGGLNPSPSPSLEELYVGVLCSEDKAEILHVPFVRQKPLYCSEASASMVLQYYGFQISQDQVHDAGFDRFENMLPFLQRYVEAEYQENFSLEEVKREIDRGNPVILRLLIDGYRHSVVVVGYDEEYLYIHDPDVGPYLKANPKVLEELWRGTGKLAITLSRKTG